MNDTPGQPDHRQQENRDADRFVDGQKRRALTAGIEAIDVPCQRQGNGERGDHRPMQRDRNAAEFLQVFGDWGVAGMSTSITDGHRAMGERSFSRLPAALSTKRESILEISQIRITTPHRIGPRAATLVAATVFALAGFAPASFAVDWNSVKGKDIALFYPAQMSWEDLLTQADHSGAAKFRDGKDCRQCHEGEEADSGKLLVTDKTAEPAPIAGKPGSVKANVKFAHDDQQLYVHIEFEPGSQPDAGMEPKFDATKVAMMFDDGKVTEMDRGGCLAALPHRSRQNAQRRRPRHHHVPAPFTGRHDPELRRCG